MVAAGEPSVQDRRVVAARWPGGQRKAHMPGKRRGPVQQLVVASALLAAPALAQVADDGQACLRGVGSSDQLIASCSALLQSSSARPQDLVSALHNRGTGYLDKGDDDRAIADFSEEIRLDAKSFPAFSGRGQAYLHKRDFDKAIADLSEAIRLYPILIPALTARGTAYASKGDNDRAIQDLTAALKLNPKNPQALAVRGNSRRRSRCRPA